MLVNTSTVDPARCTRWRATTAHVVDAGVLGNLDHARDGELRVYAGGTPEAFERCRAVLDDLGKEVLHVGALGAGMELKLVLNLVMGLEMQALAEAAAFGESRGLDRTLLLQAIAGSGFASPVMRFKTRRMIAGRYGDPDFRLRLMAKDLGLRGRRRRVAADDRGRPGEPRRGRRRGPRRPRLRGDPAPLRTGPGQPLTARERSA